MQIIETSDGPMTSDKQIQSHKESRRTVVCFFFFGVLSLIYDEISVIAAEDVLAGSTVATSTVVLSIALPVLLIKLTAPWVVQGVSHIKKVLLIILLFISGLIILVFTPHISGRLLGVSVTEAGVSLSEITFLSLTAFYEDITVSAFVAGIGTSSLVGPLYYTGLTTWFCVSPKTTMMLTIPWPLLVLLLYALIDKEPLRRANGYTKDEKARIRDEKTCEMSTKEQSRENDLSPEEREIAPQKGSNHVPKVPKMNTDSGPKDNTISSNLDPKDKGQDTISSPQERGTDAEGPVSGIDLGPKDRDTNAGSALSKHDNLICEECKPNTKSTTTRDQATDRKGTAPDGNCSSHNTLTWREKLSGAKQICPYIVFLFITYLAEYLSNHAVITTLAFPSSTFSPRDHYPYYLLSYHIGKFLGRSHFFVIYTLFPSVLPYIHIKQTWTLALVQVLHLAFFILVSWYRFVTHAWVIIVLCMTEGFTAGSMYVNSAHTVSEKISAPGLREFALCILTVGNACGKLAAGLLGLVQEPLLKEHCLHELGLGEYCFTRHAHHSAWGESKSC